MGFATWSKITKVNVLGSLLAVSGILSFFAVKMGVTQDRVKAMKARQRMAESNRGDYEAKPLNCTMSLNTGMQLDASKMQIVQNLEIEMMSDMYNRMTAACHKKCIPPKYQEADLTKGESICTDRCVAKYLDVHERIGRKLTTMSAQDEEAAKTLLEQQQKPTTG